MLREFKQFVLRGNLVDLAVAVVIGTAFGAVITSLVGNVITPLIAAIIGKPDFSNLTFTINHSTFRYGAFINSLISFIVIATVVFFLVIKPVNAFMRRTGMAPASDPKMIDCPECLTEIPEKARRCPNCTSNLRQAA
jgi:large conductance mechanosensitive channel